MKTKKLLSLLLSGAMALSAVPQVMVSAATSMNTPLVSATEAMEGYNIYSTIVHDTAFGTTANQNLGAGENHDKYSFNVTGHRRYDNSTATKRMTILDRDADGNYLLMNNDGSSSKYRFYGYYVWGSKTAEEMAALNLHTKDAVSADFDYDVTDKYSIAAHLVNTDNWFFLHNGTGNNCGDILTEVQARLLEKEWAVEPETIKGLSQTEIDGLSEDLKTEYNTWLSNRDNTKRTMKAKVVLPSAPEVMAYKDKMYLPEKTTNSKWQALMTRSMVSYATYKAAETGEDNVTTPASISYTNCFYRGAWTNDQTGQVLVADGNLYNGWDATYGLVPIYWVDKDFFKNVKVDLDDTLGSEVKKQLQAVSPNDLKTLYTNEEIESLGYTVDEAMIGYEKNPSHDNAYGKTGWVDLGAAPNHDNYTFTVTGHSRYDNAEITGNYTVLDRDANGNYLLISNSGDNTRPFYNGADNNAKIDKKDTQASDYHYSVDDEKSIGYYLGKDVTWNFLHNAYGNNVGAVPKEMQQYIIEKDWEIEPETVVGLSDSTVANLSAELKAEYNAWLANRDTTKRTVKAKVVIPSATELETYKDKIKIRGTSWDAFMTRTNISSASYNDGAITYNNGFYRAYWDAGTNKMWAYVDGDIVASWGIPYYHTYPMFWVSADFFKKINVNIDDTLGVEVKRQITQYTDTELQDIYSFAELTKLGYDVDPAMLGYGTYPKAETMTSLPDVSNTLHGVSPAENVFYVGEGDAERRFILLDRDMSGNYFVMADEEYGSHKFTEFDPATITSFSDQYGPVGIENWYYDPTNEDSVAYWLNTDFLANGNGGKVIPQAIQSKMLEKDWEIENNFIQGDSAAIDNAHTAEQITDNAYTAYSAWKAAAEAQGGATRKVKAKIALPSYTEFKQYKDKISSSLGLTDWQGDMMRTTWSEFGINAGGDLVTNSHFYYLRAGGSAENPSTSISKGGDMTNSWAVGVYKVRPVFWVSADFFKTVKVNSKDNAFGANVAKQITTYNTMAQLVALGYTETDLLALGYKVAKVSNISFADANGNAPETLNGLASVTAKISVSTADAPISRVLILAVYDENNKLVGIDTQPVALDANQDVTEFTATVKPSAAFGANYTAKAMLWDSLSGMVAYKYAEL